MKDSKARTGKHPAGKASATKTLIPSLLIAIPFATAIAAWIWLMRTELREMRVEEQEDLDAHAILVADALMSRAHDDEELRPGPPPPGPDDDVRPPLPPPRHPPHHAGLPFGDAQIKRIRAICKGFHSSSNGLADVAFEVCDMRGKRLYATPGFPDSCEISGLGHLAPPIGDAVLRVAHSDGGAAFRARAATLKALGAALGLVCVLSAVCGIAFLLHLMRHERRDSLRKTEFIDNVSHELKTPLAGITVNAELLLQGRIANEERRTGALEAILAESDRLAKMVDRLLAFSRVEKGTFRYDMDTFDLAKFVDAASERQAIDAISDGRARICIKSGATVCADVNALRQIGVNLVTNAVKYSAGPIDIEVDGCEIRYKDRGDGIPKGDEKRIFERFYRVDSSLASKTGGAGLGLPIARAIARGMGGDVTYSPRPGGGSVFTLKLKPADTKGA